MKLFNTRTQQTESFQPIGDEITLCLYGPTLARPTPLNQAHLYCMMDVLVRYLEEIKGWTAKYAQVTVGAGGNAPDGRQTSKDQRAGRFIEHIRSLNLRPPDRTFGSIDEYIDLSFRDSDQVTDLCMDSAQSTSPAAPGLASSQTVPSRFRLQVAAIDQGEPQDSLWPVRTLGDMVKHFSADAVRIYMAQHHYRSPWTHDEVLLEKAAQYAERLQAAMKAINTGDRPLNTTPAQNRFVAALDNDLDTRKGIATLLNLADEILFRASNGYSVAGAQDDLRRMASVFGLRLDSEGPEEHVVSGWAGYNQPAETA